MENLKLLLTIMEMHHSSSVLRVNNNKQTSLKKIPLRCEVFLNEVGLI